MKSTEKESPKESRQEPHGESAGESVRSPLDERRSVALLDGLAKVWSSIRAHHPRVPGVMLLAAPTSRRIWGHFAPLRWQHRTDGRCHEVLVEAEHLADKTSEIVGTLLHEAAHALNFDRGIRDCTPSQYHNQAFKRAAEELGLAVEQRRHYGYACTRMTDAALTRYAEVMKQLEEALIARFNPRARREGKEDSLVPSGKGGLGRHLKAVCQCGFIIRVSRNTLTQTTIRCEQCRTAFSPLSEGA